ncbi:MAG: heterodisulfide reductase-related iron-sulfur binding cluster [Pseudomonadota bacterium]
MTTPTPIPAPIRAHAAPGINELARRCVGCGFCLSACPTYDLLRDERDSPRGRIRLMTDMMNNAHVSARTVTHLDRCLGCLACAAACPSGVDYPNLINQARAHIHTHHRRPLIQRAWRFLLTWVLTRPSLARPLLLFGTPLRTLHRLKALPAGLRAAIQSLPTHVPPPSPIDGGHTFHVKQPRGHVALLSGCIQQVLAPQINAATLRLLHRRGFTVTTVKGCCGALPHHLGMKNAATGHMSKLLKSLREQKFDAVIYTASGCGGTLADAPHLVPSSRADWLAHNVHHITPFLAAHPLEPDAPKPAAPRIPPITYHCPCSMRNTLKQEETAPHLLRQAGIITQTPKKAPACCGSAGIYHILQPEIAHALREQTRAAIDQTSGKIIVSDNIGCLSFLAEENAKTLHTAQLLDWAESGTKPT